MSINSDYFDSELRPHRAFNNMNASSIPFPRRGHRPQLEKTEICRNWSQKGHCMYGSNCHYAHGNAEMLPRKRISRYNTKPCPNAVPKQNLHYPGPSVYGLVGANLSVELKEDGESDSKNTVTSKISYIFDYENEIKDELTGEVDTAVVDEDEDLDSYAEHVPEFDFDVGIIDPVNLNEYGECIFSNRCNFAHPGDIIRLMFASQSSLEYWDSEYYSMIGIRHPNHPAPLGIYV